MHYRTYVAAALVGLIGVSAPHGAQAEETASKPGWTFSVAPYIWLPTINATLDYNLPSDLGGRLPTEISAGPGDYIDKLHFAAMVAGEARYDRFSILTDIMYVSLSTNASHVKSIDFFGRPSQPISRSVNLGTSTSAQATIWTLAGGYTVMKWDWGNLDVIAGFRYVFVDSRTNYDLALTVTGPRGNGATFGGADSISGNQGIWNGIVGMHGRIRLGEGGLFIPYYFDIGAGGSNLTWQIASGLGYQKGWVGASLTYRYMAFEQGSSALVRHLGLGGPMLAVNFDF